MTSVGIEWMNAYAGSACIDVKELALHRGLDLQRFDNLMMKEKTVALPFEDPVSFAVNAAKPILDELASEERARIELLIVCTESGIDFSKSIGTYVHDYLGLSRNCRVFEIKQACYSGTAGLQMAAGFIGSQASPGAKALVIAVDISRFMLFEGDDALAMDWSFAEPSGGAGAVAMLVGDDPAIFALDTGANGYCSYEVMDTCRPIPDSEAGDADLSLMSYLDCCEQTFKEYSARVDADYKTSFHYLAFHAPFGGMVKGAHRSMMRKFAPSSPKEIEQDFVQRVASGLDYCQRVGNIMGATLFLSLAGIIDGADLRAPRRIGCFSYGSGCASEFFSGVATQESQDRLAKMQLGNGLRRRRRLSMTEYDDILSGSGAVKFGTKDVHIDNRYLNLVNSAAHRPPTLILESINSFHRKYVWK